MTDVRTGDDELRALFSPFFFPMGLPHPSGLVRLPSSDIKIVRWLCSVFPIERTLPASVRLILTPDMLLKLRNYSCLKHVDSINTVAYRNDPHTVVFFSI